MRVADVVANFLVARGARHVFLVTGGGAMHLNDAITHHPQLKPVYNHHEQACAIAAEGYARITGEPGIINVTTGPGSINALNGVFGAWTDSIPMIVISGQVKRETSMAFRATPGLRQLGDQEVDILAMVRGITKYAAMVRDPSQILQCLTDAWQAATTGRPGPVWIDIPVDVQGSDVVEANLAVTAPPFVTTTRRNLRQTCDEVLARIQSAKRPVILAGTGIRCGKAIDLFQQTIRRLGIPVATAWTHDIIDADDPLFCGRQGSIGDRAGNYCVQNADFLLILGSRMAIRQLSYNWPAFARHAFRAQVDIDPAELSKPTFQAELPIVADIADFLRELQQCVDGTKYEAAAHADWVNWCKQRLASYPSVLPKHRLFNGTINPYHFVEVLGECLGGRDIVCCGNATATIVAHQAMKLKFGQRLISNSGSASMGWDLPAAIGAAFALQRAGDPTPNIICLAGDGSIQMNLQELQTIVNYQLPIKIFVLNNSGYVSIRGTQKGFFNRLGGADPTSGVTFPDMYQIATAYGIKARRIDTGDFTGDVKDMLSTPGPVLADVVLDPAQGFEPRLSSRRLDDGSIVTAPLEDMFPFLPRDEHASNILFTE